MESLALAVTIILSALLISGPITILLTSRPLQEVTEKRLILKIIRRALCILFGLIGIGLAIQFLYIEAALPIKLFSISTIAGNIYALRREIKYTQSL